jgi:hypothetical protein
LLNSLGHRTGLYKLRAGTDDGEDSVHSNQLKSPL